MFVCILTHGIEGGKIHAADGLFNVTDLYENFEGDACESLQGKPKLFFIQACRGTLTDAGIFMTNFKKLYVKLPGIVYFNPKADFLIMKSTSEGFYSFRNVIEGSWFIQSLCEELTENIEDDLMKIVTGVNRRVAFAYQSKSPKNEHFDALKQMPNIESTLTKKMYFKKKRLRTEVTIC